MYGSDRSGERVGVDVGAVDGRTILAVSGRVGVGGDGVVRFVVGSVTLGGVSHAVYITDQPPSTLTHHPTKQLTLFVSISNLILSIVVVILFTRSAVPNSPFVPKPQPRFGLFGSLIVPAAALMTVLRLARSWAAGVMARTEGARMMPLTNMVVRREGMLVWVENMSG